MPTQPHILVTAANGQLGRLVIDGLLKAAPECRLSATVRGQEAADRLAQRGVQAHVASYDDPASFDRALAGVDRVLLISSSEIGARARQHRNVIEAARRAGIKRLVYTSVLHADTSRLSVADEHRDTAAALRASGVPFAILRNGWYTENYAGSIGPALAHDVLLGSAGDGRISAAARIDYADAAVAVLTAENAETGRVYELAGDTSFTLSDFAAELGRQAGKPVAYKNVPEADYAAALRAAGLPEAAATMVAGFDTGIAAGALVDESRELSALIGRPTTPYAETITALRAAAGAG